jgi:hypothetical protein
VTRINILSYVPKEEVTVEKKKRKMKKTFVEEEKDFVDE